MPTTIEIQAFAKNAQKHVRSARNGRGPLVISEDEKPLAVLLTADEYDELVAKKIRRLLNERIRSNEPCIDHAEAMRRLEAVARGARK